MKWLAVLTLLVACARREPTRPLVVPVTPDAAIPDAPPAPTVTPLERAKQVIDAQLAAMMERVPEDANLRATFDPSALVLIEHSPDRISEPLRGFADAFTRRAPHETVLSVKCDDLVANGIATAVWFTCMLRIQQEDDEETMRVTELLTAESSWRVAVAAFTVVDTPNASRGSDQANATTPLTLIATDPRRIAELLEPSALVTGFEERYPTVAAARTFLESLPAMTLEHPSHEVTGNGWGYAIAQLTYEGDRKYPMHVSVLLIAIRDRAKGWRVVAVHYR